MSHLAVWASGLISLVFLVSSVSKLSGRDAFQQFVGAVRDMRVLPEGLARPVAVLMVGAEVLVWTLALVPIEGFAVAGLLLAACLLLGFAVGIGLALRRGVRAACRCFGYSATPFSPWHVVRNVVLALVAVAGAVMWIRAGSASFGGLLVALVAGLLMGGIVTVLDDLVDLFRPVNAGGSRPR